MFFAVADSFNDELEKIAGKPRFLKNLIKAKEYIRPSSGPVELGGMMSQEIGDFISRTIAEARRTRDPAWAKRLLEIADSQLPVGRMYGEEIRNFLRKVRK